MKKPRANNAGLQNQFEVFRDSTRRPSCLAGYFTWPQVALTHHVFHRAYTPLKQGVSSHSEDIVYSERTVGAALRGHPRLEYGFKNSPASNWRIRSKPRAATEGRPYSSFRVVALMGSTTLECLVFSVTMTVSFRSTDCCETNKYICFL